MLTSLLHTSSSVCINFSVSKQGLLNFPSYGWSWTFLNVSQEKTKRFGRKTVGSLLQHQAGIWSRGCYKDTRAQHLPLFGSTHEHKWRPQIAIRPYCVNLGFPCHTAFFGSNSLIIFQLENQLAFFLYLGVNT